MSKLKELINRILELDSKDLTIGDNQDPPGISQMCAQLDKENFYYNSAPRLAKACEALMYTHINLIQWLGSNFPTVYDKLNASQKKALAEVEKILQD